MRIDSFWQIRNCSDGGPGDFAIHEERLGRDFRTGCWCEFSLDRVWWNDSQRSAGDLVQIWILFGKGRRADALERAVFDQNIAIGSASLSDIRQRSDQAAFHFDLYFLRTVEVFICSCFVEETDESLDLFPVDLALGIFVAQQIGEDGEG